MEGNALLRFGEQRRDDKSFLTDGKHTDVEFRVQYGSDLHKTIKAHKMVLAMRNGVFEAMFYGNQPKGDLVVITGLHPDGFNTFIKYLYGQKPIFTGITQALHTRTAAQEYNESKLVEHCDEFILDSMQPADVCDVLEYATKHKNLAKFDDVIDSFLEEDAAQVLQSKSFIAASRETVMKILKNPRLNIKEYEVIKSVGAWVVAYSRANIPNASIVQMQQVMKPFLAELRFLTLTPLEFVEGPSSWNIFSELEAFAVLSNIIKRGSKPLPEGVCSTTVDRTYIARAPSLKPSYGNRPAIAYSPHRYAAP